MKIQDWIIGRTQTALDDLFRNARAIPEDQISFAPNGIRSVLDQVREIALTDLIHVPIIESIGVYKFAPDIMSQMRESMNNLADLAACESAARLGTSKICMAILQFPEIELEKTVHLPFGGGLNMQMADVLGLHYWNLTYHLGQICQIQLMLGDPSMH